MHTYDSLNNNALAAAVQAGALGVIPTDTVYDVVCSATNETAVKRLYDLKNREHKPGTIVAASVDQLVGLGIKRRYLKAVEQFWPGPVSVIIFCPESLAYLHLGKQSLAVRVPLEPHLIELLKKVGPLLSSSANLPGRAPATTLKEAQTYFGDQIDFYMDGGDRSGQLPSTIIRVVDDAVEVVRPGASPIENEYINTA